MAVNEAKEIESDPDQTLNDKVLIKLDTESAVDEGHMPVIMPEQL